MGLKRRDFLQRTGLALATLSAGEFGLPAIAQRYQHVLAEPTRRKLALLVGINQYRQMPLSGCVTDVDLQRELLHHRFGFQTSDILTLTDQQATREAIVTAFMSHLIEQAKAGDVVVFHFSGYGDRLTLSAADGTQKSLVTVADPVMQGEVAVVDDLLEDTLLLLLRSLLTDKVTTILDTSYTPHSTALQGNLRVRTRPSLAPMQPSEAALSFQESLLSQSNLDRARLQVQRQSGQMPGIVLSAAGTDQVATETTWNGFSAGLFTYALTQHLWQATPATALRISLRHATEQMSQLVKQAQKPQLSGQKSQGRPLTPYHLPSVPVWGADGVVLDVEDSKTVRLWLGGLPATVLEQAGTTALFTLVEPSGTTIAHADPDATATSLQIVSRDGLVARAKLYTNGAVLPAVQVGQFVREQVRVLPRHLGLTIALDRALARIERVDAISAFSGVPRVSAKIAGEQAADYLFSKTQDVQPTQVAALPTTVVSDVGGKGAIAANSYGLFSLGQTAIPQTAGESGEAVKVAVRRLIPKLQMLLAAKLLTLTVNDNASRLAVRATLDLLTPPARELMKRETLAIAQRFPTPQPPSSLLLDGGLVSVPLGSRIQFGCENQSDGPVYLLLLSLDSNGDLAFLYSPSNPAANTTASTPTGAPTPQIDGLAANVSVDASTVSNPPAYPSSSIAPHKTLTLPQASTAFQWLVSGPTGLAETYLLCSRAPFSQTMSLLGPLRSPSDVPSLHTLTNPLEVVQAVLQDLHQASDRAEPKTNTPDAFMLDLNVWASLHFVYQVV